MKNNKPVIAVLLIAAFLVGLGVGYLIWHISPPSHSLPSPISPSNVIGTPFASFSMAQFSYMISGNASLSPSGKLATNDFNLTSTKLANGSITYSMTFAKSGMTYNVTLNRSDKLYFIDTNLGDDTPGADISTFDDGYVAVNATGYIVAFKYPLIGS